MPIRQWLGPLVVVALSVQVDVWRVNLSPVWVAVSCASQIQADQDDRLPIPSLVRHLQPDLATRNVQKEVLSAIR